METRESDGFLSESPGGRAKSRPPGFYNEARRDAELDEQLLRSEAPPAGRGKRNRRAVSYEHAYLTGDWADDDFEEDEAAYQQRQAKRRGPTPGVSLYEALATEGSDQLSQQLDLETAWAVGFMPGLSEEEEGLLPQGSDEKLYTEIRNRLLTQWREDVSRCLSLKEAELAVPVDMREYARVAWTFLNHAGYINFGVAPAITEEALGTSQTKGSVIIIGAGMAGLAAARKLRSFGFKVVVLEGRGRPGGRVYTKQLQGQGHAAVGDLGGSIITGIDGNPLAVLAAQLNIPLHAIDTAGVPLYLEDGRVPHPSVDKKIEKLSNELLDSCDQFRETMGEVTDNVSLAVALETLWGEHIENSSSGFESHDNGKEGSAEGRSRLERRVLDWHFANLEFANAAPLRALSLRTWDQDDPHEMQGAHCFLPGGNIRLVAGLAAGLHILYNSVVQGIDYAEDSVRVRTAGQIFEGDAVLVTVPLGVLKNGNLKFDPPLPERKLGAIQRMGFGVLNKVVMLFPHSFWGSLDMFGRIAPSVSERGEFFLFYSYAHISGGALLAALVAGDSAEGFEQEDPKESAKKVLRVLRGMFAPKNVNIPAPLQVVCTRWGSDPMAYGSYSSIAVGALGGEEYDILAEHLGGRVFFAGEHTTKKHPATMHGAFFSGHREAANINATFAKRKADAEATAAAERAAAMRRQRGESRAAQREQVQQQLQEAQRLASQAFHLAEALHKVFGDVVEPPDAEFGCFAALYGPRGSRFEKQAILRTDIGLGRTGRGKPLPVLIPVSRSDVTQLRSLSGGDDARFGLLMGSLGIKLVGRARPLEHLALIRAILHARGIKLPQSLDVPVPDTKDLAAVRQALQEQGTKVKQNSSPLATLVQPTWPKQPASSPAAASTVAAGQHTHSQQRYPSLQQQRPQPTLQQNPQQAQTSYPSAAPMYRPGGRPSANPQGMPMQQQHQYQQHQHQSQPSMQHIHVDSGAGQQANVAMGQAIQWPAGGAMIYPMQGAPQFGQASYGQYQYPGAPTYSQQTAAMAEGNSQHGSMAGTWRYGLPTGQPTHHYSQSHSMQHPGIPQTYAPAAVQPQPQLNHGSSSQQAGAGFALSAELLNSLASLAPALQQLQQPSPQ